MLKTTQETVTITRDVVKDIVCNKCGGTLKDHCDMNYEGLVEISLTGGYASKIGDMLQLTFSICEDCLIEMFKNFKFPPTETDHWGINPDIINSEQEEEERDS